jgi:hypothetical protein
VVNPVELEELSDVVSDELGAGLGGEDSLDEDTLSDVTGEV